MRLLFLYTGNSARSQMAEAIARHLGAGTVEAFSAGTAPRDEVHPLAMEALREAGIASEGLHPKHLSALAGKHFDFIITVCDRARESCPVFPEGKVTHWGLADPAAEPPETAPDAFAGVLVDLCLRVRFLLEYVASGRANGTGAAITNELLDYAARTLDIKPNG